jgi:hypothetical protein
MRGSQHAQGCLRAQQGPPSVLCCPGAPQAPLRAPNRRASHQSHPRSLTARPLTPRPLPCTPLGSPPPRSMKKPCCNASWDNSRYAVTHPSTQFWLLRTLRPLALPPLARPHGRVCVHPACAHNTRTPHSILSPGAATHALQANGYDPEVIRRLESENQVRYCRPSVLAPRERAPAHIPSWQPPQPIAQPQIHALARAPCCPRVCCRFRSSC